MEKDQRYSLNIFIVLLLPFLLQVTSSSEANNILQQIFPNWSEGKIRILQNSELQKKPFSDPKDNIGNIKQKINFGTISKEVEKEQQQQSKIQTSSEVVNEPSPLTQKQKRVPSQQTNLTASDGKQKVPEATKQTKSDKPQTPGKIMSEINKPILGKGFKVDNGISYQFLHVGELQKKYLFFDFKLSDKDSWQKANFTVNFEGTQQPLIICEYNAIDSCYLPNEILKKEANLFITIQCEEDCTYNLKVRWSDLEHLHPGQEIIFMFGTEKTQLFHVELEDEEFEEVRIHLAPRATIRPFDSIKIYGKYGKQKSPTEKDHDFKSVNLWQDGEGIFLLKKKMKTSDFTLLIVGKSDTTYRLTCELVTEKIHEIQNNEHLYEYLQSGTTKQYCIKDLNTQAYSEFLIKFSVLSGEAKINYYTDSKMTNQLPIQPIEYMKDSEYFITKQKIEQSSKEGIYIKVTTDSRDSSYTLKYVARTSLFPVQLNEHIYSFIPIVNKQKFAYFNFKNWIEQTQEKKRLKFTVSMIKVVGQVTASFRVCKTTLEQCINPIFFNNLTNDLTKIGEETISEKRIIEFQIPDSMLTQINAVQKEANILVRLQSENSEGNFSLIALEFFNNNKVLYLREGRPLQQKLTTGETRFYKYINSDPDVTEIRIHVNQITGNIKMQGIIKQEDTTQQITVYPQANTLKFTKNLTQPIILSLTAQSKAIVGISMQILHKTDDYQDSNIIAIGQDLTYTVKIQPFTYTIFEVVPIYYNFNFHYSATQSVIACLLNTETNKCVDSQGKELIAPQLSTKSQFKRGFIKNRKGRIKITNPFGGSVVEVTIIFHSRIIDHCQSRKIGYVYHELVEKQRCFEYPLEEGKNNLDIYVSKREFSNLAYTLFLCGNSIQSTNTQTFLTISSEAINQKCSKGLQGWKLDIYWNIKTSANSKQKSVKADFLVQYQGGLTILPEGVGYHAIQKSNNGMLRKFAFNVINKLATKVVINQVRGDFTAFARIIKENEKLTEQISNINYQFQSTNDVDYRQEPIITINQNDMKAAPCIDCMIIIAVYTTEQQGNSVEFQIEVVQNVQSLNDNSAIVGYLQAGSFAYYTYETNRLANSTLMFVVSDHNERCTNLYLGLVEYPGPQSKIASASASSILTYRHTTGEQKYFLTVQSIKICEYSVTVVTADSSIQNLQRGKQILVQLTKGNVQYFVFEHNSEPFKIFAMSKFGQIKFHLNQSSIQINRKVFTSSELDIDNFEYKSEEPNVLSVGEKSQIFCQDCTYFLAVQAIKNTISTLLLVYPQTIIPLAQRKYFNDYLEKKGDSISLSYKKIEKTQLQVTVHKGEIEIAIIYKQTRSTQIFTAKSEHQYMVINVKNDLLINKDIKGNQKLNTVRYTERIPVNIIITAKAAESTYTLQATSLQKQNLNDIAAYQDILAGQPNHVKISSEKVICLTGFYRDSNEDIVISTNNDNQKLLNNLLIKSKINKIQAKVQKTIVKNMITLNLTFNQSKYEGAAYQICLMYEKPQEEDKIEEDSSLTAPEPAKQTAEDNPDELNFNAIVTQVNTINLLPSDTQSIVKGQSTFTIHHEGQFLLEVFQCEAEGEAKIKYGKSISNIKNAKGKSLELFGLSGQHHSVRVSQQESTTYVNVNSKFSVIRWLPIDPDTDGGTGYMKFSVGDFRYTSKFKYVSVQYQTLQSIKKSKSLVKEVEYSLLISNDSEKLQKFSKCDKADQIGIMVIPLEKVVSLDIESQKSYLTYDVDKDMLQTNFPVDSNIYMTLTAKLTLEIKDEIKKNQKSRNPSSDEHEHYRFIYNRQQMPLQKFKQSQIESIPYHFLFLIVISVAGLFLLLTYLVTRKIIPMLARLRNSKLVEEKDGQAVVEMIEVPPSSDRNQRANIIVETEDKFNK